MNAQTIAYEDAKADMDYAEGDIAEAAQFAASKQFVTAVNLLSSITTGIERAVKNYPEFTTQAKPLIDKATELTLQIIKQAEAQHQ